MVSLHTEYLSGVIRDVHRLFQFLSGGLQKFQFFVNFLYFFSRLDESFEE